MAKQGGGVRKHGRNKKSPSMLRYNAEGRAEKNRIRKLNRHIKNHPNDLPAISATNYAKLVA